MSATVPWSEVPATPCKGRPGAAGCGQLIRWVVMPSKKCMPVDAEPSEAGTLAVDDAGAAQYVGRGAAGPRYVSHFATCTNATAFSRGRA